MLIRLGYYNVLTIKNTLLLQKVYIHLQLIYHNYKPSDINHNIS